MSGKDWNVFLVVHIESQHSMMRHTPKIYLIDDLYGWMRLCHAADWAPRAPHFERDRQFQNIDLFSREHE